MSSIQRRVARLVAAAGIAVAVLTHGWLTNGARELHGGLLSFDSGGDRWNNADLVAAARDNGAQDVSTLFAPAGQLTFGLGLLAAALLVGAAIVSQRWLRYGSVVAVAAALAAGVAFVVTRPSGPAFGIGPGWSAMLFVLMTTVGAILGKRE